LNVAVGKEASEGEGLGKPKWREASFWLVKIKNHQYNQ